MGISQINIYFNEIQIFMAEKCLNSFQEIKNKTWQKIRMTNDSLKPQLFRVQSMVRVVLMHCCSSTSAFWELWVLRAIRSGVCWWAERLLNAVRCSLGSVTPWQKSRSFFTDKCDKKLMFETCHSVTRTCWSEPVLHTTLHQTCAQLTDVHHRDNRLIYYVTFSVMIVCSEKITYKNLPYTKNIQYSLREFLSVENFDFCKTPLSCSF